MGFRTYALALLIVFASWSWPAAATASETVSPASGTTAEGNSYVVPDGWRQRHHGASIVLEAPEPESRLFLIDVQAKDADTAVAAAWSAYDADAKWPLQQADDRPAAFGWEQIRRYRYQVPASAGRLVSARAMRQGTSWTVLIVDFSQAAFATREPQLSRFVQRLWPKGYAHVPESFAGKTAHKLDPARLESLTRFVGDARVALQIPGVALGLIQDGKVVFAGGFGQRDLGRVAKVDADTMFLSASITKPLTTLMLAKLVDAGKLSWETPVTEMLPSFKLGDASRTPQVRIKHLICACTGMPRQDMEWLFASEGSTPESVLALLSATQPTAKFGEVYQYSNPIAAVAGYAGGHVFQPDAELGAAYDAAMQTLVFDPLGMSSTTFDYARAQGANWAAPHGRDLAGTTVRASQDSNYTSITMRPDGGAWSSVNDLLRYVRMELDVGLLPEGKRYIGAAALLARREPQVTRGGENQFYGMGLKIDRNKGTSIVWHGGSMAGYQTEVQWLPEHGVGHVLLTNADAGAHLRGLFSRRLLEVLFDAEPQAVANLALAAKQLDEEGRDERARLTVPAELQSVARLANRYYSAELGELDVERKGNLTWFDFGIWDSEVATRRDADGSIVFVTSSPSVRGYEFRVSESEGKRALVLSDGLRDYTFVEGEPVRGR